MSFDIKNVGGFGDGSLGDATISSTNIQLNSYANVTAISSDGKTLTIGAPSVGSYGGFVAGQEIMFHVTGCLTSATADLGKYGFAKILSVGTGQIVLDTAVLIINLSNYICQIVTVPNFNNLTVNCAISALAYNSTGKYGGIIIAKAKTMDLTNGSLLAVWKGIPIGATTSGENSLKPAGITTSNSDIINRIIMPQGNGIVIPITSNLILSPTSRLGANWSGALSATHNQIASENGGAGYGGGAATLGLGSSGCTASTNLKGGDNSAIGGLAGYCGGYLYSYKSYGGTPGAGGAVVIILASIITGFTLACFSTGGGGGIDYLTPSGGSDFPTGGGGPGFGYIGTKTTTIPTDSISYALDTNLLVNKRALIKSKKTLDCSKFTSVDGFTFSGSQPAGTDRRVLFSLGTTKVAGSRTFPITTNAATADTVTIAGITLTAVASGATGNQFNVGATVAATAANIATALNANMTFNAIYSASADSSGVITVSENSSHIGYGNTPAAASKTGTIVFGTGTATTSVSTWFKLTVASGVASMVAVATQTPTLDSVLAEGNAIADLTGITSIPTFVGQQIYTAVALMAPFDAVIMPTLALTLNGHNNQDQYQKDEISAEYTLSTSDVDIVSVTADVTTTGQATATVMVSLKQSGTWSGYMSMINAKGQKASAIKYKATYTVSKLDGTDSAKVNKVSVIYCAGTSTVSGDTAELLTVTQNYQNELSFAQCLVKHKALMDAQIKAFVSFRSAPKKRTMLNIGTGNGNTQTITLQDTGINHNTLSVQYDGKPVFDYGYNTETSQITFTAANGVAVTASYEYGWENESWAEMTAQDPQVYSDSGYYATKFTYSLPSGTNDKTISDIKIQLYRPSGMVTDAAIGTATGQRQLFVLPHFARKESIVCSGSWSYDDNSRILTVVADKDVQIKASYNWLAETQEIYGLTAGWAE